MKRTIKSILKRLGYQLAQLPTSPVPEAFIVQKRLLGNQDKVTIVDAGAYDGETALLYNAVFPQSTIFSFEPFPESFKALSQNVRSLSNIHIFNQGLGNMEETRQFNSNTYAGTNSFLESDKQGEITWGTGLMDTMKRIPVQVTTIDAFVQRTNLKCIDILKMDVQGAEALLLEGAKQSINQGIIKLVYTEIITMPTYLTQSHLDEFLIKMRMLNFELFNFYSPSLTSNQQLRCLDALFVHSPFLTKEN